MNGLERPIKGPLQSWLNAAAKGAAEKRRKNLIVEMCDMCGEGIVELDPKSGSPSLKPDEQSLVIAIEPIVRFRSTDLNGGGQAGISKRFVVCSTECAVRFTEIIQLCWNNPKYATVPLNDRLEAFIEGKLKPLQLVEKEEMGGTDNQATHADTPAAGATPTPIG